MLVYAVIFLLSSRPASTFPKIVPDVVPHFIEYALLAFLFMRMFDPPFSRRLLLTALALLALSALLDEIHQYFVPTRYFEIKDIIVDISGILAGMFLYTRFAARRLAAVGEKD